VLGLIPAAALMSTQVLSVLREEGRSATVGRGAQSMRRALVVAQVGCAFVLLIGAGLLFATFRKALAVDPGFVPAGVLTAAVSLPDSRYQDAAAQRRFTDEALRRIGALPTVTMSGATDSLPLGNSASASAILAEGYQAKKGESVIAPNAVRVSPGYFEAMRARLVAGRFFDARDTVDAPKVIIIDNRLARRFWPNQDPIGRRMYTPSDDGGDLTAITAKTEFFTVVGIVSEMKQRSLTDGDRAVGSYFFPLAQEPQQGLTFVVRSSGDTTALASALRREIAAIDAQLPVFEMQPMTYWTARSLADRRGPALLSMVFGFVALFLSAIGIYGVLAFGVAQRVREFGIRQALGADQRSILSLVLTQGMRTIGIGLVLGLAGAFALTRLLQSQLFGVSIYDPGIFAIVTLLLLAVALLACYIPARRATEVDPMVALRDA
jgi:predicted permease